jgi:LGFP repeat
MATINDLQAKRWNAIDPTIPFAPDNAIQRFWLEHPELGSPLGPETPLDDGSVGQAFANGVLTWTAANGVALM